MCLDRILVRRCRALRDLHFEQMCTHTRTRRPVQVQRGVAEAAVPLVCARACTVRDQHTHRPFGHVGMEHADPRA